MTVEVINDINFFGIVTSVSRCHTVHPNDSGNVLEIEESVNYSKRKPVWRSVYPHTLKKKNQTPELKL